MGGGGGGKEGKGEMEGKGEREIGAKGEREESREGGREGSIGHMLSSYPCLFRVWVRARSRREFESDDCDEIARVHEERLDECALARAITHRTHNFRPLLHHTHRRV